MKSPQFSCYCSVLWSLHLIISAWPAWFFGFPSTPLIVNDREFFWAIQWWKDGQVYIFSDGCQNSYRKVITNGQNLQQIYHAALVPHIVRWPTLDSINGREQLVTYQETFYENADVRTATSNCAYFRGNFQSFEPSFVENVPLPLSCFARTFFLRCLPENRREITILFLGWKVCFTRYFCALKMTRRFVVTSVGNSTWLKLDLAVPRTILLHSTSISNWKFDISLEFRRRWHQYPHFSPTHWALPCIAAGDKNRKKGHIWSFLLRKLAISAWQSESIAWLLMHGRLQVDQEEFEEVTKVKQAITIQLFFRITRRSVIPRLSSLSTITGCGRMNGEKLTSHC